MKHSTKQSVRRGIGAACLCLTVLLASCATPHSGPQALPNPALYEKPIDVPQPPANLTNEALAGWALDLIGAIGLANADRESLRVWADKLKGE